MSKWEGTGSVQADSQASRWTCSQAGKQSGGSHLNERMGRERSDGRACGPVQSKQAGGQTRRHAQQAGRQAGRRAGSQTGNHAGRQARHACLPRAACPWFRTILDLHFCYCEHFPIIVMFDAFGVQVGCGKAFGIGLFEQCACHTDSHQRSHDGQMTSETHCVAFAKNHWVFLQCLLTCYAEEDEYEVWLLRDPTAALPPPASVKQGPPWLQRGHGRAAVSMA